MITFAKGITCGYVPLGGVIVSREIADHFDENVLYCGLTYSGHPMGCAAGIATLEVYKELNLIARAKERGVLLGEILEDLRAKHPCVGEVRYIGLFSAIELVKDRATHEPLVPYGSDPQKIMPKILGMLMARGFSTYTHENCIMIAPPLIITQEELQDAMAIMDEVLTEVDAMI